MTITGSDSVEKRQGCGSCLDLHRRNTEWNLLNHYLLQEA